MIILIAAAALAAQSPVAPAPEPMAQNAQHQSAKDDCCKDCCKDMDKGQSGNDMDRMQDHQEHSGHSGR